MYLIKLARYLKNYRKECTFGPIFKFLEAFFELLLPTIMALIINNGVLKHDSGYIIRLGGIMTVLAVCGYGCACVCQFCAARASQGFGTDLRNDMFRHILGYSYTQSDKFGAPTLTNRITNDINQLQQWVAMMIRLVPRAPFICIGAVVLSFCLDAKLALILVFCVPFLGAVIFAVTKYAAPLYRDYQKKLDGIAMVLRENLSGVRVIRAFSKTKDETARFNAASAGLMKTGFSIGGASSLFNPLTSLVVNMAVVFILWFGGIRINTGRLSQGQIIAFINYVNQILYALTVVSNLIILLTKAMASASRVNEVLEAETETAAGAETLPEPSDSPAVEFKDVSFGYNNSGEKALEHISVKVFRGETLGIIGATGSGKTTFVNLIERFYDAGSGHILINGIDVKKISPAALRGSIGIVPQKALLFSGTIAENIRWGGKNADVAAVEDAARIAQADEFIRELPERYDAAVSRAGTNFSGGQRQRLTIARALAVSPEILILDDASSALDFLTDSRLRSAIRGKSKNMTVIIVSQRIGAVKNSDRILVLDNGREAGIGTHDFLIKNCGVYREICLSQFSEGKALI